MLDVIVGRRGVGKTHYVIERLYKDYYKQGCMIFSNFENKLSHYVLHGTEQVLDAIKDVRSFKHNGYSPIDIIPTCKSSVVVFIIDEAHLLFNADTYKANRRDNLLISTLAESRKLDIHIYLLTQSYGKIDKDFRRYVSNVTYFKPLLPIVLYKITKIKSKTGLLSSSRQMYYPLPIFHKFTLGVTSEDDTMIENMEPISRSLYFGGYFKKKYYNFYDSYSVVQLGIEQHTEFDLLKGYRHPPLYLEALEAQKLHLGTKDSRISLSQKLSQILKLPQSLLTYFRRAPTAPRSTVE